MVSSGMRACRDDCAMHDTCNCTDADTRHDDGAPALAAAIQRLVDDDTCTSTEAHAPHEGCGGRGVSKAEWDAADRKTEDMLRRRGLDR